MRNNPERDGLTTEIRALKLQIADLEAKIESLTKQSDNLAERNRLKGEVEDLKLEKARLVEENDRRIRETEHKVGLLKTKQDHDVEHARRMAQLEVREQNLDADRKRFEGEMKFQREHFEREATGIRDILGEVLKRLPDVTATLNVERTEAPAPAASSRRSSRRDED